MITRACKKAQKFINYISYIVLTPSPARVLAHLEMSVREFISSSPSHQFIVVYRDEVVIARFQHCQRIFVPSDPGVPRTFVVDCRISAKFWDVGRKPQNSHPQLTCFISFILNDYLLIYSFSVKSFN